MSELPAHSKAARLATQGDDLIASGHTTAAWKKYREAAETTEVALSQLRSDANRARSLLMTNAVTLWYKAGEYQQAEKRGCEYILRGLPGSAQGAIREVLFASWQASTTVAKGDYLTPIEMTLKGGQVGFGLAPLEEVSRREGTIQTLLWRASEFKAGLPYRTRGIPVAGIRKATQIYAAVPRAGSYRVMLQVKSPATNLSLFPEHESPGSLVQGGESLVQQAIGLVQVVIGRPEEATNAVADPIYRLNFFKLVRDLAPDGKRVGLVELAGGLQRIEARIEESARKHIAEGIQSAFAQAGLVELQGELVGMELQESQLKVTLRTDDQNRLPFLAPLDAGFEAKVAPLWGRRVRIEARATGTAHPRYELLDVEGLAMESDQTD